MTLMTEEETVDRELEEEAEEEEVEGVLLNLILQVSFCRPTFTISVSVTVLEYGLSICDINVVVIVSKMQAASTLWFEEILIYVYNQREVVVLFGEVRRSGAFSWASV